MWIFKEIVAWTAWCLIEMAVLVWNLNILNNSEVEDYELYVNTLHLHWRLLDKFASWCYTSGNVLYEYAL